LARLFFLRGFRCTTECGWRGLRFSRSQYRRQKRKLRALLFFLLFVVVAAITVRYVLARIGSGPNGPRDEGILEVE